MNVSIILHLWLIRFGVRRKRTQGGVNEGMENHERTEGRKEESVRGGGGAKHANV